MTADYADPIHADAILTLLDRYACDPMGAGAPLPGDVLARLIAELARRPMAFSLLARVEGCFVGLANCFEGFSSFAARPLVNIHDVFVEPAYRGRGVGQALLAEVARIAGARGCIAVTLEVLEGNHAAQAAYRRAGFDAGVSDPGLGGYMFWKKRLAV